MPETNKIKLIIIFILFNFLAAYLNQLIKNNVIKSSIRFEITFILFQSQRRVCAIFCHNKNCSDNRVCCQKCLSEQYHQYHTNEIQSLDTLQEFVFSSSKNVKGVISNTKQQFESIKSALDIFLSKIENKIFSLELALKTMNTIQLEQLINYSFQYDELERLLKTSIDGFASNIQKTLDGIYNNYSLYDKINVDEYLLPQMGDELFKKGDFIRALDFYDQALQINPDNFKANLGKANSLRATQKYLEAEKFYIKAKSQKQNDSVLLFGFGECLRQQMKIDKAIIEYDLAVQIDENYDEAAFYLGVCHIYLGIWRVQFKGEDGGTIKNELFSYFKRISTLGYDGTYKTLSNALFLSLDGYFQEAIKMIEQVLKTSPQNYEALLLISFLLFGNENYNLSLEFLEKIETQDLLILFLKSLCLLCIDLQNSSIKLLDKILDSTPGNQYAQMFKGVCLLKIKQPKEALAIFNTILEAYPQNEDAKSYKDQCLKEIGDENETNQDQEFDQQINKKEILKTQSQQIFFIINEFQFDLLAITCIQSCMSIFKILRLIFLNSRSNYSLDIKFLGSQFRRISYTYNYIYKN